jgi:hypothetical protein
VNGHLRKVADDLNTVAAQQVSIPMDGNVGEDIQRTASRFDAGWRASQIGPAWRQSAVTLNRVWCLMQSRIGGKCDDQRNNIMSVKFWRDAGAAKR